MADDLQDPKLKNANTVKAKIKAFNHKQKNKRSKKKKKSHIKARTTTSPKKNKKKSKKRHKTKQNDTTQISKPPNINLVETNSENEQNKNPNTSVSPHPLQKTLTSPLHSSSLMAHESIEANDLKLDPGHDPFSPLSPFQQITDRKTKRHKFNSSYFQNYFDRGHIKPEEMLILLDLIENDMQFMFSDSFLSNSVRTKKIFALSVSLHAAFMQYKLSFLFPMCKRSLLELDSMFLSVIKWFNRLKRYYRSPSISKYKQQITKLKNDVDRLINSIESHCSIVLYALIRSKQLYVEFHKNSKLLIFWIALFPENELEFVELSWTDFVHNIRKNKSFKKFKKFNTQDMIHVLTQNYEVLTIEQFIQYVAEYESVQGWFNDMYKYIGQEIAHPHKKQNIKHNNDMEIEQKQQDMDIYLQDWIKASEQSIKNMIQSEITPKISDLITRFDHIEQSLAMIRAQNEHQRVLSRANSMVIHSDVHSDTLDSDDDDKKDGLHDISLHVELDDIKVAMEPVESNGTVVIHETPRSIQVTPVCDTDKESVNVKEQKWKQIESAQSSPSYSSVISNTSTLVIEKERESWNKTVKALESEISALKSENYEQKEEIINYELRLEGVALKSKQVFTLQSKLDYHEKLSALIKKRCFALHQQLSADLMHFIECDHNITDMVQRKLNEIGVNKHIMDELMNVLSSTDSNSICDSVQNGITEIFSIHQQLKDLCVDIPTIVRKGTESPVTPQPSHFAKILSGDTQIDLAPIITDVNNVKEVPRSRTRSRTSYGRYGPQSHSASATPNTDRRTLIRQTSHKAMSRRRRGPQRPQSSRDFRTQHQRQQTYSVALKQINDESALSYSDCIDEEPDDDIGRNRTHSRGQSSLIDRHRRRIGHRMKHTRFKTAAVNLKFLSAFDAYDDSVSDVISTLSSTDYQIFDEYNDYDEYDENSKEYINIFNSKEEEHIPLHSRSRSYRFPGHNTRYSVVDPLTILDEHILSQLNEKQTFTEEEMLMKNELLSMLREMDVMGESRLDIADFTSGIMNAVNDYDDIMEDAELLFETMQNLQDDMGTIKIEDIVDAIMLNNDDGAAKNIKNEIIIGLNLNIITGKEKPQRIEKKDIDLEDIMPELNVKPIQNDPNQEPFKPIYQTSNGIQKINTKQ